ncbi:DUF2510 domain-containing protein [Actinacidiphila sp. ITFR-21]|uniref:DUF2510 domain-containing protein n=1 Tax=Actinacidiphila sp. ITFR-21 TaxID=3075199 RepID=UPI002889252C|nr:DUF2510 domain-containing protein [Streptomyces sp. ITFR-21]WNI14766.1 DUF2510 domain-containing protein [Streptomyces sp. ITFR-21]
MTTTTPPGWYPEPGHTGNGPAMERWWDGTTWTEYTRTAPAPTPVDAPPVYPGHPVGYPVGYPPPGPFPEPRRRRTGTVVVAVVLALVLIGGVVAAVLAAGGGSGKDDDAKSRPTPSAGTPESPRGPGRGGTPLNPGGPDDPGGQGAPTAPAAGPPVDVYDGIRLPVPAGWQGSPGTAGVGANISTGAYTCPGDDSGTQACSLGGAYSAPAQALKLNGTTPEAVARADIAGNAADSYNEDTYGATTSHQQIGAGSATVAGQKGYYVRWKVQTESGTDGYVESLAFPSPADKTNIVVVRFGFDITDKAPGLEVMDEITQGIKADSSGGPAGSTGGTGV